MYGHMYLFYLVSYLEGYNKSNHGELLRTIGFSVSQLNRVFGVTQV